MGRPKDDPTTLQGKVAYVLTRRPDLADTRRESELAAAVWATFWFHLFIPVPETAGDFDPDIHTLTARDAMRLPSVGRIASIARKMNVSVPVAEFDPWWNRD